MAQPKAVRIERENHESERVKEDRANALRWNEARKRAAELSAQFRKAKSD
jgi:hypothetical protein